MCMECLTPPTPPPKAWREIRCSQCKAKDLTGQSRVLYERIRGCGAQSKDACSITVCDATKELLKEFSCRLWSLFCRGAIPCMMSEDTTPRQVP